MTKEDAKRRVYKPLAGDIIIFARNGASHTGIVKSTTNSQYGYVVHTIEGNTTSSKCNNTDCVAEQAYSINDVTIDGYGQVK